MCGRLDHYLQLFDNLEPDKSPHSSNGLPGRSCPEKPFLLLSILDHIAADSITREFIGPGPNLDEAYRQYAGLLPELEYIPNIALPLYQLQSSGFWTLKPRPDQRPLQGIPQTLEQFRAAYFGAELDRDLFVLLKMASYRERLREVLINRYFAAELRQILREQANRV